MNDRQYAAHRAAVGRAMDQWKNRLWLGHWILHVEHNRHGLDQREVPSGSTKQMVCNADWRYQEATIGCDCPSVSRKSVAEMGLLVLHELLHAAVHEAREWREGASVGLPHEERVVTHLTNVLVYAYKGSRRR
jgi:hypothetical protein